MIKTLKIILTIISSLVFIGLVFFTAIYYIDGLFYIQYSKKSIIYALLSILILSILTFLFILLIIKMFKSKHTKKCTCLLIILTPFFFYLMIIRLFILMFGGSYGCSYTENIKNYKIVDYDVTIPSYFPENITDDMTVIKYAYYHKQIETCNTDLYLEVKFNDLSTMENYLSIAKQINNEELIEYQNPYNDKYTDIFKGKYYSTDDSELCNNYVIFNPSGSLLINYESISYSYEELTIIYNYTKTYTDDIYVGDHKEKGEYYPKFLERFNVEPTNENEFFLNDVFLNDVID